MFEVVVVGAGLGGMLSAAMLGRSGRKVLLIEREEQLGGRLRSFDVEGGFVLDAGAYLWPDAYLSDALARAGATGFTGSEIPRQQVLRLFAEGEGGRRLAFPFPRRTATAKLLDSLGVSLGVDAGGYDELSRFWQRLVELSDEQVEALRHVPLRDALAALGASEQLAAAFRRNVMLYGTYDPDCASTAECIEICRHPAGRPLAAPIVPGANPGGGVRALVRTLESALAGAGVEILAGTAVERVLLDDRVVRGVAVRDARGGRRVVECAVVVSNVPIWQFFDLVPADSFAADFVSEGRAWSAVGGVIAAAYAFRGMPRLRETSAEDDFPGWTRLLIGTDRGFGGGMVWTTLHSPVNAPPGCHVLQAMRLSPRRDIDDATRAAAVHDSFDRMVGEIYLDAADKMLWSRRWTTVDGTEYLIAPAKRPPVAAPGIGGLYFVGETTDVPALQMDAAALSALRCMEMMGIG